MAITPRENILRIYRLEEPDYMPLGSDIQGIRTVGQGQLFTLTGNEWVRNVDEIDFFGQNWKYEATARAYNPDATNYIIKDVANWRDYVTIPDLEAIDWIGKFEAVNLELDRENKMISVRDPIGIWERAFSMFHSNDLYPGLLLEPEAMFDFFSAIADHKIQMHNYYIDYYKPDMVAMNDDYGNAKGLFMSPATWRELIKPNLQRIIDNVTSKGLIYEHHCCGYMVPLAEEIAEMGASSWNSVHFCNNPPEIRHINEKMAFTGGMLNTWFLDAPGTTEEQIRTHVREMVDAMLPGYMYISGGTMANPERNAIVSEEILMTGQKYYKESRPS